MIGQLDNETSGVRRTLLQVVKERPGIHFRGLERAARLSSVGQLRHHIDHLQRQGILVEVEDGGYKRFFLAGQHQPKVRAGLARFARPVPRRIATLLMKRPMTRTELRRQIGCADSTLGYHLTRMVLLGDVSKHRGRNCCLYQLTDPDFVRSVLQVRNEAQQAEPSTAAPTRPLAQTDHTTTQNTPAPASAEANAAPPVGQGIDDDEEGGGASGVVADDHPGARRVAGWRWVGTEESTDEVGAA